MMSDTDWPSTHGLSVYNVLKLRQQAMGEHEILASLQDHFDPRFHIGAVRVGLGFLLDRRFIRRVGERFAMTQKRPLVRVKQDSELAYG